MEILTYHARIRHGLSLRKMEKLTGISKSCLNSIENGLNSPTLEELEQIAKALAVPIEELYASQYK